MLLEERLEVPLGDGRQGDVGLSRDGGAPPFMVQERHLAERVTRSELAGLAGAGLDRDGALGDDHESNPALAADNDLVAGVVLDGLHLLLDRPNL